MVPAPQRGFFFSFLPAALTLGSVWLRGSTWRTLAVLFFLICCCVLGCGVVHTRISYRENTPPRPFFFFFCSPGILIPGQTHKQIDRIGETARHTSFDRLLLFAKVSAFFFFLVTPPPPLSPCPATPLFFFKPGRLPPLFLALAHT